MPSVQVLPRICSELQSLACCQCIFIAGAWDTHPGCTVRPSEKADYAFSTISSVSRTGQGDNQGMQA